MSKDSTDKLGVFTNSALFDYRHGEDEFIKYHKDNGENWTTDSIRFSEMHFNLMYVERQASFVHFFMQTDFSGGERKEVFCSCTGAECFEDTSYVAGCTVSGERRFVPASEDSIYWVFAKDKEDYDGTVARPSRTSSRELRNFYDKYINHVGAYTLPNKGSLNNSFYIFPIKKAWPGALGDFPSPADAAAFHKVIVAHEIGHYVFGFFHSRNRDHIMYKSADFHFPLKTSVPFVSEDGTNITLLNLAQNIWSQPVR